MRHAHPVTAPNGAPDGAPAAGPAPFAPCPPMKSGGHGGPTGARAPHNGAANGAADGAPIDAPWLVARLEEAGETLLALPASGFSPRLRTSAIDIVRSAAESYGQDPGRLRLPPPPAARISRMDEALGWLALIPDDRYVLRRIVASRMLVSPATGRHLYPWRRLATLLGADHKAIQRWHGQGIALLVAALARR